MKSDSILNQHYNELFDVFGKWYQNTLKKKGIEEIHQLRVSIKKIRAILPIIEIISNGSFNKKKHYVPIKSLFKTLGYLRLIHINLLLLKNKDDEVVKFYKIQLLNDKSLIIKDIDNVLEVFDFQRLKKQQKQLFRYIQNAENKETELVVSDYISKKLDHVIQLFAEIENDNKLHKIRIYLKSTTEITKLLYRLNPKKETLDFQEKLKETTQLIGIWHDYIDLIYSLENFEQQLPSYLRTDFVHFIKEIKQKNENRKHKIKSVLEKNLLYFNPY